MNFRHLKAQMGIMGRVLLLALRRLDDGFATAARTGDRLENAAAEEANKADSVCSDTEKAMNEFKDQLDATEKEKVTKLIAELREIAVKGQAGDASVTADAIREKINETQQASLGLFQKVYEKRNQENASENTTSEEPKSEEKKD